MLSIIICLLPLLSHLQPVKGETTGELLESIGSQTHKENYNEIVCTFNVKVSLSRVDFVDKKGSAVFAIVDCGTSCNVLSSYQDVLRIVSPEKTISGDRFVFNATHLDKTTGTYTCHGIPAPEVVYTSPSGTGHGDGHGDGEESQMTSAPPPQTDEVSHNAGGGSNGLLALIIIPILLVLIGVVLFLHWRGVIQIPGLPKTRGEPRDLRRNVRYLLQPVTGCWERTRGLSQPTREDTEHPLEGLESSREENKQLLGDNEDKLSLHHDKMSFEDEGNDGVKEQHPFLQISYDKTKPTQDASDASASVEDSLTSPQPTLSTNSTDSKEENSDVEDRQTSLQYSPVSNIIEATDVTVDLSAASLSPDNIQHKKESPHTKSHASAPHDTGAEGPKPTKPPPPPKLKTQRLKEFSSVTDHKENDDDNKIGGPSQSSTESENDDVSKKKSSRDPGVSLQHTPQRSGTRVETERENNERMNGQLQTARTAEGRERTEERKGDRVRVDMKEEEESRDVKSETINNEDMKGQLTTDQNKEDLGGQKEREDDKEEVEVKEKETLEIKSETESKEDARQKQERIEETMAEKVEKKDKEEAKSPVEQAQEMKAEAVSEQTAETRAETVQTSQGKKKGINEEDNETACDDNGVDKSRNGEGYVKKLKRLFDNPSTGEKVVENKAERIVVFETDKI